MKMIIIFLVFLSYTNVFGSEFKSDMQCVLKNGAKTIDIDFNAYSIEGHKYALLLLEDYDYKTIVSYEVVLDNQLGNTKNYLLKNPNLQFQNDQILFLQIDGRVGLIQQKYFLTGNMGYGDIGSGGTGLIDFICKFNDNI